MSVGIVAVSHSKELAEAAVSLASQMVSDGGPTVRLAAGTSDGGFGTDAMLIMSAIEEANSGEGVVVLTDLGSAILSADMALDFLGEPDDVVIVAAPFVEGLLAAIVTADSGASLADVVAQARGSLDAKIRQLSDDEAPAAAAEPVVSAPLAGDPVAEEPAEGEVTTATLINPNGLHARPAAQLTRMVAGFDAVVELKFGDEIVSAKSPLNIAGLGTRGGDELIIRATGSQAKEAAAHVKEFISSGFGEVDPSQDAREVSSAKAGQLAEPAIEKIKENDNRTTVGVSPGRVVGVVKKVAEPIAQPLPRSSVDVGAEKEAFAQAVASVDQLLADRLDGAQASAAEILTATREMLADESFSADISTKIDSGQDAASATWSVLSDMADKFARSGGLTAERVTDIRDLRARLVAALTDQALPCLPTSDSPFVLVAHELAPADITELNIANCLAIITAQGGPTSHTSILARAMGIPAVLAPELARELKDDDVVLIDGATGEIIVHPTEDQAQGAAREPIARADIAFSGAGQMADGKAVAMCANIGTPADIADAQRRNAQGVGLFRTEFSFFGRQSAPSLVEQTKVYGKVFEKFAGQRVVIRTLDAGADKPLPFVTPDGEANPALGVRGYRTSIRHPEVLDIQLQAIAAAAKENADTDVWVMAPMISTAGEARQFAARAKGAGIKTVGVMVETPSVALTAESVLAEVDFLSIGTNDLTQYTMAADREEATLASLSTSWQPAVLRLIEAVGRAGQQAGKHVGVCGEAAGDDVMAAVLIGLGVSSLSMNSVFMGRVAERVASVDEATCKEAARAALAATDPTAARAAALSVLENYADIPR